MKPDWKDAPEWAKWLAQDEDGTWTWYEDEPVARNGFFRPVSKWAFVANENKDWKDTLEARP